MTLKQIIYDLWSIVRGGDISDDDSLSERLITEWIIQSRSELIRRAVDKGQSINPDIEQTLDCIKVSQVDASECECTQVNCPILRTDLVIPPTVECSQGNLLTRVSSPAMLNTPFSIIPFERVPYCTFSKFGKDYPKAFLHNQYIYIISPVLLDTISIKGVFEDPRKLNNYIGCSGEQCFDIDNSVFPLSSYMMNILKLRIQEVNFKMFLNTQPDILNDARNEEKNK